MKPFISPALYGVINWGGAFLCLALPWTMGFYVLGGAALFLMLLVGWLQFIMAVFSNAPHGFLRKFPMQMHSFLDIVTGSFLMASPFVYAFSDKVFLPQLLLGGMFFLGGIFAKHSPVLTHVQHNLPEGQLTSTDSTESRLNH